MDDDSEMLGADFDDLFNDADDVGVVNGDAINTELTDGFDTGLKDQGLPQDAVSQPNLQPVIEPRKESKELLSRLDELALSGCSQKIAWSRMGSIATVGPDNHSVLIHVFLRDPTTQTSSIESMKPQKLMNFNSTCEIAHLAFSPGSDLVVIDKQGGVTVHTMVVSLQRLYQLSHYDSPSADATGEVIALHWLDRIQQQMICPGALRKGDIYDYPTHQQKSRQPCHPTPGKSAAVILSRSGTLRLLFPQADQSQHFVRTELDTFDSSEHFFTHAAIIPKKAEHSQPDRLLIVASDTERSLRFYQAKIEWRPMFQNGQPNPKIAQKPLRLNPIIDTKPLRKLMDPLSLDDPEGMRLTHLNIVTDYPNPSPSLIESVIAIYAMKPDATGTIKSRIIRWTMTEEVESLNSAFTQLGKHDTRRSEQNIELKRQSDIDIPSVIVSARYPQWPSPFIFTRYDGEIEFRNRYTLELVAQDASTNNVQNAAQCGVGFANEGQVLHVAFSPNQLVALTRSSSTSPLKIQYLTADESHVTANKSNILALYALMFTSSFAQHHSNDDVLALVERDADILGVRDVLEELLRAAGVQLDLSASSENNDFAMRAITAVPLQRCLSFQQALTSRTPTLAIPGKVAGVMLTVRHSFHALRMGIVEGSPADHMIDVPATMIGILNYLFSLFSRLAQTLYCLSQRRPKNVTLKWVQGQLEKSQDPTLTLIVASAPRFLLRHSVRILRDAVEKIKVAAGTPGQRFRGSWVVAHYLGSKCPINLKAFEQLLLEVDHKAREAAEAAGLRNPAAKTDMERKMMVSGVIPDCLAPVVVRILDVSIGRVMESETSDVLGLLSLKSDVLGWDDAASTVDSNGVDDDAMDIDDAATSGVERLCGYPYVRSKSSRTRARDDVLRKMPMSSSLELWKRCGRCGNIAEDLPARMGHGIPIWLLSLQKGCICGVPFVIEKADGYDGQDD